MIRLWRRLAAWWDEHMTVHTCPGCGGVDYCHCREL